MVLAKCGPILERNPDTVRGPDVSFVLAETLASNGGVNEFFLNCAPDLAVEVLSFDNHIEAFEPLAKEYFRAGTRAVWIIDPQSLSIFVQCDRLDGMRLGVRVILEGGDILPGFAVKVSEVFA